MSKLPQIHLCVQQPAGYVHSLGLLDQARYFRYQFRRLGARVSLDKNRLRHDAVNFVFGAHLGFEAAQRERHACVFVNLEQLGEGGARVSASYLKLLANSAVVDYDAANRSAYAANPDDVPVVALLHAPYLKPEQSIALEERPIDLLFIGSINERRRAWLDRIEALGLSIAMFDGPLYGPERDRFIVQAKAVVNTHFYASSRFEQARVAHCLSLGTPVISERAPQTQPHPAFEDCVLWLEGGQLEQFFAEDFGTPAYFDVARQALQRFEQADPVEAYADLLAFAAGFAAEHHKRRAAQAWQPQRINLGSGTAYKPGWLNIDLHDAGEPDLVLDLAATLALPISTATACHGQIELAEHCADVIHAGQGVAEVRDLAALMGNALRLLKTGGEFQLDVPGDFGPGAGRAAAQALHEGLWLGCGEKFWALGWFSHRFEVLRCTPLDAEAKECAREQAVTTRVVLHKVETSLRERTTARALQFELRLPEDEVDTAHRYVFTASAAANPPVAALVAHPAPVAATAPVPVNDALARLRREPLVAGV